MPVAWIRHGLRLIFVVKWVGCFKHQVECPGPTYHQRQLQLSVRDTQKPKPSVWGGGWVYLDAASWEGPKKKQKAAL